MIYSFSLSQVSVWAGLGLLLSHGWGLLDYRQATQWIRSFPRGDGFGGLLLALATGWSAWLAGTINLMEYTRFRPLFVLGVIGLGVQLAVCSGIYCGSILGDSVSPGG